MIALAAALAAASPPFAPPLDRALRYAIEERRPRPGGDALVVRTVETARYAADGDGFVLTLVLTGLAFDGPADPRIEAAMRPWIGVPVRLRLARGGEPVAAIDAAASWAGLLAGLAAVGADDVRARFAALPAAARDAMLLHAADDIGAASLPPLAPGGRAATPDGEVRREAGGRYVATRRVAAAAGTVAMEDAVTLDPATGLVAERRRTTRAGAGGAALAETRIVLLR